MPAILSKLVQPEGFSDRLWLGLCLCLFFLFNFELVVISVCARLDLAFGHLGQVFFQVVVVFGVLSVHYVFLLLQGRFVQELVHLFDVVLQFEAALVLGFIGLPAELW